MFCRQWNRTKIYTVEDIVVENRVKYRLMLQNSGEKKGSNLGC